VNEIKGYALACKRTVCKRFSRSFREPRAPDGVADTRRVLPFTRLRNF
jgi:hypothetical protein